MGEGVNVFRDVAIVFVEEAQAFGANLLELFAFFGARLAGDAAERGGIEIVVGEDQPAHAHGVKLVHFVDDLAGEALAGLASIGDPYGAEAAIFGAAGDGLNRREHIEARIEQIPSRFQERFAGDASAEIFFLQIAGEEIFHDFGPNHVAVAGDHGVGAHLERLVGENRGMDAAHHDGGALGFRLPEDVVTGAAIAGADADADEVVGPQHFGIEGNYGFIDKDGIADEIDRSRLTKYEEPSGGDHGITHRGQRWVHEDDSGHKSPKTRFHTVLWHHPARKSYTKTRAGWELFARLWDGALW